MSGAREPIVRKIEQHLMSSTSTDTSWRSSCVIWTCLPVLMVMSLHNRHKERLQRLEQLETLPVKRERELSIRHADTARRPRPFLSWRLGRKKASYLLDKLPPEIRSMIYVEVLGGHVFRIERRKTNLGHISCKHNADEPCFLKQPGCPPPYCEMYNAVGAGTWPPRKKSRRFGNDPDSQLLALAKTCRKIYSECIDIVYSHNTFHIPSFGNLLAFQSTVLDQRLRCMKSLHIHVMYHDMMLMRRTWMMAWDEIAENKGLEDVRVVVDGYSTPRPNSVADEMALLAPLRNIATKRKFEIHTCWQPLGEYDDAPFTVDIMPSLVEHYF